MKKIFLLLILCCLSSKLLAANMGTTIDLMHSINQLEHLPHKNAYEKQAITDSLNMIAASDQTMAETIMLMIAESARERKPIFCVPTDFDLSANSVEQLIMQGYDRSELPIEEKQAMPAATFAITELHRIYPCHKKTS